jgi:hypothetical protein
MKDFNELYEAAKKDLMPFESWEILEGETSAAYAAFCFYRDFGDTRTIKLCALAFETGHPKQGKCYGSWKNWSTQFVWKKRATDYDIYLDKLARCEKRKAIEANTTAIIALGKKMIAKVDKRIETLNDVEISASTVKDWFESVANTDRNVLSAGDVEVKPPTADDRQQGLFDIDFKDS